LDRGPFSEIWTKAWATPHNSIFSSFCIFIEFLGCYSVSVSELGTFAGCSCSSGVAFKRRSLSWTELERSCSQQKCPAPKHCIPWLTTFPCCFFSEVLFLDFLNFSLFIVFKIDTIQFRFSFISVMSLVEIRP